MAEGDWLKGILFAGAETACIIYIVDNSSRGSDYYTLYKEATTIEDAVYYRQLTEKYDKRRNIGVMAAIGIWALNILDMALFGDEENPASINEDKNVLSRMYIEPTDYGGLCVGFRIIF